MAPSPWAPPRSPRDLLAAAVPGLAERMLVHRIRREWAGIVGEGLARRSEPLEIQGGTLHVGVDNSPWLHEVTLRAAEMLAALQARYGGGITAVRPLLRHPAPAGPPPNEGPVPSPPLPLTGAEVEQIECLLSPIGDPGVAAAIRRVLVKDHLARRPRAEPSGRAEPARTASRTAG